MGSEMCIRDRSRLCVRLWGSGGGTWLLINTFGRRAVADAGPLARAVVYRELVRPKNVLACCKTLARLNFLQRRAWAARSCGMMRLALMGIALAFSSPRGALAMDDSSIRTAVRAWISDPTAAEATYGHISTWETGGVTDMSYLFCAKSGSYYASRCNTAAASFNEDISAWDTSGVTSTYRCLLYTSPSPRDS